MSVLDIITIVVVIGLGIASVLLCLFDKQSPRNRKYK